MSKILRKTAVFTAALAMLAAPALAAEVVVHPDTALQTDGIDVVVGNVEFDQYLAPSGSGDGKSDSFSGNSVTLESGTVESVLGAININSDAVANNKVFINGGTVNGSSLGNAVYGGVGFSSTFPIEIRANSIVINGDSAQVNGEIIGGAGWGFGSVTAEGNSVALSKGTVTLGAGAFIYGGYVWDYNPTKGTATAAGNSVSITGGSVTRSGSDDTRIIGGQAFYNSTDGSGSATATGNTVTIDGGAVNVLAIIGGAAGHGDNGSLSSLTSSATASNNSVFLNGGTVGSVLTGGLANADGVATAINNTVTISNKSSTLLDLDSAAIMGGRSASDFTPKAGESDFFTGNTLNLYNYDNDGTVTVASAQNFENYNLFFSVDHASATPVLTGTGTIYLNDEYTAVTGKHLASTVTANTIGEGDPLEKGSSIVLISAGTLDISDFKDTVDATGVHGTTVRYTWDLTVSGNTLTATLKAVEGNPQAKALSEGFSAGADLLLQSADLAADEGMASAVSAAGAGSAAGNIWAGFGGVSGGALRYNSGSYVDVKGFSLLAGLSRGQDLGAGRLTFGAFAEFGWGSYDTVNTFTGYDAVEGSGDTRHFGGGLLGRMDFGGSDSGHPYLEGAFRAGGMHNEYQSNLVDDLGRAAAYTSSSPYVGLNLGGGYILNFGSASLDLYGKYFWTRQGEDSVVLPDASVLKFEAVNSHRLRAGARLGYDVNSVVSLFAGAAYEHELDGESNAVSHGIAMDAPSLRGGTGIGELGLSLKPAADLPISVNLGVQGYVGKRQGVTGSLELKLEF